MSRSCAEWTEVARPLATIPQIELSNISANDTISRLPHLFEVSTPINSGRLETLLEHHPNPSFVKSVLDGLRNGFWPWADTHIGEYPDIVDESLGDPLNLDELNFICEQRDREIEMGRFSESFGSKLLPGMYSMPIHAVPKPNSDAFRLVTNQSAGAFSLNSMIRREDITGYPLDNMTHLGEMLIQKKREFPNEKLVLFKSDIAEAYRLIPVHPLWQIKQINTIEGLRHVDRRNCFGGKASGSLFIAVNALITWIAKNECGIRDLATYCDDSFGVELMRNFTCYAPYGRDLPSAQASLLTLWDQLGVPHKEKKQVFGSKLTIIGIDVDADSLTLTLPDESRSELLAQLKDFARLPEGSGVKYSLKDFQRLTGWFNWALNVYPLLRPALSNVYAKMSHAKPDKPLTKLYVNNAIRSDLLWAVDHLSRLPGTRILQSLDWDPDTADLTAYCDASLDGLGFWFPSLSAGFWSLIPEEPPSDTIFFFEAISVLSAILHSTTMGFSVRKLVVYTDNMNTVQIFNSLSALPAYNDILKAAVDHLLSDLANPIQLRVIHTPTPLPMPYPEVSSTLSSTMSHSSPLNTLNPHVSEGSWGQGYYDSICSKVQATPSRCLDQRTPLARAFSGLGSGYRHLNLEKLQLSTQLLPLLRSHAQFPHRTNPRYPQLLHRLYVSSHKPLFSRHLPIRHLPTIGALFPFCSRRPEIHALQENPHRLQASQGCSHNKKVCLVHG